MNFLKKYKTWLICLAIGIALGLLLDWAFRGKPVESVKIERDTIVQYDTIPHYFPVPKDSALVKYITVKLPVERPIYVSHPPNDSLRIDTIEAEIPVTQKHYKSEEYQAWVSGYMPNLDSIEVYQKTSTITETITITQTAKQKHWGIGVTGGCQYYPNIKQASPFAGLQLKYDNDKWGAGISGGYIHDSKTNQGTPYVSANLSYNIFSF